MCGIAGLISRQPSPGRLARMVDPLGHRGPDDRGEWSSRTDELSVGLGHTRLAVLDLSAAGHQPMTRDGVTVVYNGELYNYPALRRELDFEFRSATDTEALLALYLAHGPRMLQRLVGMFAFALWDERRQTLFAARDRLGIKPLAYRLLGNAGSDGIAFASELSSLLALGRPSVDATAIRDFFSHKVVPAPKTIWQGIEKLLPGHFLTWCADEGLRIERYWHPESSHRRADRGEALEELEALLEVVVGEHTLADVPVGVFLSGGIDSSTVAAHLDRPRTFTLGFDVGAHDESAVARRVARHLGTDHRELELRAGDLETAIEQAPRIYDEPFGDHGAWPVHLISKRARQEVTVALTGEGGDELFGGYHWYRKVPALSPRAHHRIAHRILSPMTAGHRSAHRRLVTGLERYATFLGPFTVEQKRAILAPELATDDYDDLWAFRRHWCEDLEIRKRMQWIDLHTYLPDDMLTKLDRASMAVSLEARPPLLDHRLVDFALSLHPDLITDGRRGKVLLRELLARRVPPATFERPKIGLTMPVRRWVKSRPGLLRDATARLHRQGILRRPRVRPHTNEQAWSLLMLDGWLRANGGL